MIRDVRSLRARLGAVVLGGLLPLLLVAPAFAQTATGTTHEVTGVAAYGAWDWISLTLRIAAVLLVIWSSVVAMRWYVRRMNGEAGGGLGRALHIVETRPLGPSRALHLVRLGDRAVLIGATPERINTLMEINDPSELQQIFAGGDDPARRVVPSLFAGLAALPGLVSKAGAASNRRPTAPFEALSPDAFDAMMGAAPAATKSRAARPVGALTGLLTRLGRRMHGATATAPAAPRSAAPAPVMPAAPAPASTPPVGLFGTPVSAMPPLPPRPSRTRRVSPALAAFEDSLGAMDERAPRAASLFDRTLADAQLMQGRSPRPSFDALTARRPMFGGENGLRAAGLRARTGYGLAMPDDEEITRQDRIDELQRAIIAARRNAG